MERPTPGDWGLWTRTTTDNTPEIGEIEISLLLSRYTTPGEATQSVFNSIDNIDICVSSVAGGEGDDGMMVSDGSGHSRGRAWYSAALLHHY